MKKYGLGRILGASILAFVLALLSPLMTVALFRVFLPTVLVILLWAWAGFIPAGIFSVGIAAMANILGTAYGGDGQLLMNVVAAVMILPAWGSIYILHRRPPFFKGLFASVAVQCAFTALGVVVLWTATGKNVADLAADILVGFYKSQDAQMQQITFAMFRRFGIAVTKDNISAFLDTIRLALRIALPTLLMTLSVSTGLLTYALPCRILVRRGEEPQVDIVHLSKWRLPKHMVLGIPAIFFASLLLGQMGVAAAGSTASVLFSLGRLMFAVQGIAAVDRAMKRAHLPDTRRTLMIVLLLAFTLDNVLPIAGIFSALFGSEGIISGFIKRRNKNRKDDNKF
ncbi:MAG: DUF2232 domain-containing protein [Christensenellales bacterium]